MRSVVLCHARRNGYNHRVHILVLSCIVRPVYDMYGVAHTPSGSENIPKDRPIMIIGIYLVILTMVDPLWLMIVIFALVLAGLIFLYSILLGWQTVILGVPSMFFFCYAFFFEQGATWVTVVTAIIFIVGFIVTFRESEDEDVFEVFGVRFSGFSFVLALLGVFVVPNFFPQFNLLVGIAEILGTATGLIFHLYVVIKLRTHGSVLD